MQARFWLLSLPAVQFSPGCSHAAAAEKFPPWGELFQYGQYRGTKGWVGPQEAPAAEFLDAQREPAHRLSDIRRMDPAGSIEFCCCATAGNSLSAHAAPWIDQQEDSTTLGMQDRSMYVAQRPWRGPWPARCVQKRACGGRSIEVRLSENEDL